MLCVSTQIAKEDSLTTFEAMLKSVSFADELVIFNLEREDQEARRLFAKYHARVIEVKTPPIVEAIRQAQVEAATADWVLVMDYDELVTAELRGEIEAITENMASCSAYAIGRDNFSLGSPLRHGGWERDYVVRLLRKADFVSWPKEIHSAPIMKGTTIKTTKSMEHHKDASLTQMVAKTNRYSQIEAEQFYGAGFKLVTPITLLRKWWMESLRRGLFKWGILDGKIGVIQSIYQGYSVFITYAKLYEKQLATSRVISETKHGISKK